jgi:DNA-directed RNA polymerase specialized sigma24 family protein
VVAEVVDTTPTTSRAELLHRLELALAALPPAERTAVVAAHGYGEGPIGAAVELDLDSADADALTRNALQLLRAALADVDADTD